MHPSVKCSFAAVLTVAVLCLLPASACRADDRPPTAGLDRVIRAVAFRDASGKTRGLADLKGEKATVVVFVSFDCPVSTGYAQPLAELARAYQGRGVSFLGVSVTDDEGAGQAARRAREFGLPFPVFHDAGHAVQAFHVEVTPEAFLLDAGLVLRYRGRVDDRYAARLKPRARVGRRDLRQALEELLAGRAVSRPATRAVGCPVRMDSPARQAAGPVTFYRDVLPVLQRRCQVCHRPGDVAPFSLMTYRQSVTWADDIKDYTQARKMPPWKPVAGPKFLTEDERRLTGKEVATLAAWVDGGTPAGDRKAAPPPRRFPHGWQLGRPDLVLTVDGDFQLGAGGLDVYRCFVLPTRLGRDVHVTAVEVRPGNRRVVHHAVLFFDRKGQGRRLERREQERPRKGGDEDRGPGYSVPLSFAFLPGFLPGGGLGGWAPGLTPQRLPAGTGYLLPRGADVILQLHYHRNGRAERDRTSVGLYFAQGPAARRIQGLAIPGNFVMIPAGAVRHRVTGAVRVRQDCRLYAIMPHMHLLGRQIKVTMLPPDGRPRTLIAIKDWDFNWQEVYFFREPIAAKAGTRFEVEGIYDNSSTNPSNPHQPPRPVFVGLQTTDEMCVGFLGVTTDRPGLIRYDIPIRLPGLGESTTWGIPLFGL